MTDACCGCGNAVVYERRYSGQRLCATCFCESIVEKARRTIAKHDMFRYGELIGVAVSGGKDSLALVEILGRLSAKRGSEVVALTVDEGIPGYRDESLEYCRQAVQRLGLRWETASYAGLFGTTLEDAIAQRGDVKVSSCAICGPWRRRALDVLAERAGVSVLATAHNLDDVVQTFLINLLSGDVVRLRYLDPDLAPAADFPVRRVKPFLEIYEREIALFAYLQQIPFQAVACPHAHEGIRTEIRNFLNGLEEHRPGIKYSLLRSALGVAQNLQGAARDHVRRCERCGLPASGAICSACQALQLLRVGN